MVRQPSRNRQEGGNARRSSTERLNAQIAARLRFEARVKRCPDSLLNDFEGWAKAGCDYRTILLHAKPISEYLRGDKGKRTAAKKEVLKHARDLRKVEQAASVLRKLHGHPLFRLSKGCMEELERIAALRQTARKLERGWLRGLVFDLVSYIEEHDAPTYFPGLERLLCHLDPAHSMSAASLKMSYRREKKRRKSR